MIKGNPGIFSRGFLYFKEFNFQRYNLMVLPYFCCATIPVE
jgi:hypothetical protein